MRKILAYLREAGLQINIDKYEFYITETKFLGFIIEIDGIAVNLKKVKALKDWQMLIIVKKM